MYNTWKILTKTQAKKGSQLSCCGRKGEEIFLEGNYEDHKQVSRLLGIVKCQFSSKNTYTQRAKKANARKAIYLSEK